MSRLVVDNIQFLDYEPMSFLAEKDSLTCIYGPSGGGKSLLLRAIADLIPHSGQVFLNQVACHSIPAPEWRRRVALLLAEAVWWHDTVREHFHEIDTEKLILLGFQPQVLDWPVTRLSTGESSRLALLRLLSYSPEVLLLDEPTANLDSQNTECVEQLIKALDLPTVWVCHDDKQRARLAGSSFLLEHKKLIEVS